VHDEAHWQATEGNKSRYVNAPDLVDADNVAILCVSATPYNLCTLNSRIPNEHVIAWTLPDSGEASHYYGLREYLDATKELYDKFTGDAASSFIGLEPGAGALRRQRARGTARAD
jgi:hypothetical protein